MNLAKLSTEQIKLVRWCPSCERLVIMEWGECPRCEAVLSKQTPPAALARMPHTADTMTTLVFRRVLNAMPLKKHIKRISNSEMYYEVPLDETCRICGARTAEAIWEVETYVREANTIIGTKMHYETACTRCAHERIPKRLADGVTSVKSFKLAWRIEHLANDEWRISNGP